ncbi:MAG: four helix bundle protein [Chitinophagaceae bacterium]|jgi:four helix bundle protein|nr:four helix bundle protein [Chitinophagaceae bacterium]
MAEHIFSFEKLEVWKDARILTKEIYMLTKIFPTEEKYGLCQQIRRSSVSICSNIAEGTSRASAKDQAHFTTMAFGSLMELLNQIIIAFDLDYLNEKQLNNLRNRIQSLSVKLSNLKKSQLSRLKT